MKTIIAGSRGVTDLNEIYSAMIMAAREGIDISEVVSGTCRGPDQLGEQAAKELGIPVKRFPADWDLHGKSAGYKRNVVMGDYAEAAIIIWDGVSKGAKHMIDIARKKGLLVYVHMV